MGRGFYALVLGVSWLCLALDASLASPPRVALAWYLGFSVTLVPLSWIGSRANDHRRGLASWGASIGALLIGGGIVVGCAQVWGFDARSLGLPTLGVAVFALVQLPVKPLWMALGDAVRERLAAPFGYREPAPRSRLELHVLAIHESGHALWEGLDPENITAMTVSIERETQAGPGAPGGFVDTVSPEWTWQNGVREFYEWRMMGALAGQAAERALKGRFFVTARDDLKDWHRLAVHVYGSCSEGPTLWREATRADTIESNRLLLDQIRLQQLEVLGRFFQANREVLQDLARQVETGRTLDLEGLRPYFVRLVRVPGVPVLPTEESLIGDATPMPITTVEIAVAPDVRPETNAAAMSGR